MCLVSPVWKSCASCLRAPASESPALPISLSRASTSCILSRTLSLICSVTWWIADTRPCRAFRLSSFSRSSIASALPSPVFGGCALLMYGFSGYDRLPPRYITVCLKMEKEKKKRERKNKEGNHSLSNDDVIVWQLEVFFTLRAVDLLVE